MIEIIYFQNLFFFFNFVFIASRDTTIKLVTWTKSIIIFYWTWTLSRLYLARFVTNATLRLFITIIITYLTKRYQYIIFIIVLQIVVKLDDSGNLQKQLIFLREEKKNNNYWIYCLEKLKGNSAIGMLSCQWFIN